MCCVLVYVHVFFSICFTQMAMFSFHILFLYLLLQKMEDFCLFYALASMIFYSRSCIVCNVFISDIFEMFYAFLCILCILIQGTMVEQLCLNGFTLYKYICKKKNDKRYTEHICYWLNRQPVVLPVTIKLASWQLLVLSARATSIPLSVH